MKIHDIKQGTKEWLELRKGRLTGTSAGNIVAYREMLKAELVEAAIEKGLVFDEKKIKVEDLKELLLHEDPAFSFRLMEEKVNKDFEYKMLAIHLVGSENEGEEMLDPLQRGHDLEPVARQLFERAKGKKVEEVGFITLDEEERIGLSPDGLIKNGGIYTEGLEIKSPVAWKYLKFWLEGVVPDEYKDQCLDYFVQSPDIQIVWLMLFNPRLEIHPYHIYEIRREEYEREVFVLKQAQIAFFKAHDQRMAKVMALSKTILK